MNLQTNYLGLSLRTPLVVSANPLSWELDSIKKMESAGASAIVLYSIFEEQLRHEQYELNYATTVNTYSSPEAMSYFPDWEDYKTGPTQYLEHISNAKKAVKIPIIGSINCSSIGGWTDFAQKIESAGADAIELNIYSIETNFELQAEKIEQQYINIIKAVKSVVKIPVAIKLSPFFSNTANMVKKLDDAGVDA
ncbi:MAG: dihydroorotate dehydrogenase-like protein, partial [Bacteroidota bacterium]